MASASEPRNPVGPQTGAPDDDDDDELSDRPTISTAEDLKSPYQSGISRSVPPDIELRVEDLDWLLGAPSAGPRWTAETEARGASQSEPSDGARRSPASPLGSGECPDSRRSPGEIIAGRYRILGLAAQGGMGSVYFGEHLVLRSPVAIKLLGPEAKDLPEMVERFRREALVGAHVRHPNIATATDFGRQADGYYYLVLEFVDGTTLESELGAGPFSPGRAARVGLQIAEGLQALHDQGVIHRDLKPSNVMLVKRVASAKTLDLVKLIDFGLAKLDRSLAGGADGEAVEEERLTNAGMVFGTLAYLAPEAALGMEAVDARSDLYALGLVLYRMLAGRHPFTWQGEGEIFRKQMQELPPRFADCVPHLVIPSELEAIVHKLLAKEPSLRFQSAGEVVLALAPFADPESASLLPPAPVPAAEISPTLRDEGSVTRAKAAAQPGARAAQRRPLWMRPWAWLLSIAAALTAGGILLTREPDQTPLAAASSSVSVSYGASISHGASAGARPSSTLQAPPQPAALAQSAALERAAPQPSSVVAQHTPATEAERTALETRWLSVIGSGRWTAAAESFVELVYKDPEFFSTKRAHSATTSLLDALWRTGAPAAEETLRLLAYDAGPAGFDVLFYIALRRGGSPAYQRVSALLSDPAVGAKAAPEIRAALALYRAGCAAGPDVWEQAAMDGDLRAVLVFLSHRERCPKNDARDRAFYQLQKRVNERQRRP